MPENQLTEQDFDDLITEHLKECRGYENICQLTATPTGKQRVIKRVKQIIVKDGIASIAGVLAQIETELRFAE